MKTLILLSVLFIVGCKEKEQPYKFNLLPSCDYVLPEHFSLGINKNGQYGILYDTAQEVTLYLGDKSVDMQSLYGDYRWLVLVGEQYETFRYYKDSCLAKGALKHYQHISDSMDIVYKKIRGKDEQERRNKQLEPLIRPITVLPDSTIVYTGKSQGHKHSGNDSQPANGIMIYNSDYDSVSAYRRGGFYDSVKVKILISHKSSGSPVSSINVIKYAGEYYFISGKKIGIEYWTVWQELPAKN